MTISHATIRADTWTAINGVLKGLFPTKNIYSKFPEDPTKIKKSDYPMVVQVNPEVNDDEMFFGRTNSSKENVVMVEIYSNNPADLDTYADSIHNYFETTSITDVHSPEIGDSTTDYITINSTNVAFKIMSIKFKVK